MSFFKKLFNRVSGKEEQDAPPPVAEEAPDVSTPEPAAEEPPAPEPEPAVAVAEVDAQPEVAPERPAAPAAEAERRSGWFSRLSEGLSKSSRSITGSITSIFTKKKLDKATLQDLEDVLLQADLGEGLFLDDYCLVTVERLGDRSLRRSADEARHALSAVSRNSFRCTRCGR